jgi:hypothetical protein
MLYVNGKKIHSVFVNGQQIDTGYINGKRFYRREMTIKLPYSSTPISLRDIIDTYGQPNIFAYTIINEHDNFPAIDTGNLQDYEVTFINNGKIFGTRAHKNALTLSSQITLINNGEIYAAGGDGGKGGKGADTSYEIRHVDHGNQGDGSTQWKARYGSDPGLIEIYDGGTLVKRESGSQDWAKTYKGPIEATYQGIDRKYYRTDKVIGEAADAKAYEFNREWYEKGTATGGAGGMGGLGQSLDTNPTYGQEGQDSNPPGYNKGGRGGSGGMWGQPGAPGERGEGKGEYGKSGQPSGYSILGTEYLTDSSVLGTLTGPTAENPLEVSPQGAPNIYENYKPFI